MVKSPGDLYDLMEDPLMLDWQGHGLSVMEMSHRSSEIVGIANPATRGQTTITRANAPNVTIPMVGAAPNSATMV